MTKLMEKGQKLSHGEVLVEVLLSQVNELRNDKVPGASPSQAANQDAACEETCKSHVRGAGSPVAAYQSEVRWLSEGNGALRGRKNESKQGLLHLQRSAVKEGLSDGLEGVGVEHVCRSNEEDVVNVSGSKGQSRGVAP